MSNTCQHITTYAQAAKGDPTRTTTLRNRFVKDVNRRFNKLKRDIRTTIVTNDAFGFKLQTNVAAGPNAFSFNTSAQKVDAFMEWLKTQIDDGILEVKYMNQIGVAAQQPWTNMYIQDSYARGQARAAYELNKIGIKVPPIEQTGGIRAAMGGPFHMDRVGLLYSRTFQELKGITAAMDSQISRVLSQAMADGDGPLKIARKLIATIDGKGTAVSKLAIKDSLGRFIPAQRRAQTMARTEMIRAHHQATIQEYENWGIEGVNVKAEWSTAGDDRVCQQCSALEGNVYSLEEIRPMIPVHPNCFIDTQTPIYTSTGWKPIGKVEIGDLVLTHKNRFRKVYALPRTPKQKPEVTKFKFKGDLKLSMTSNHQVMLLNGQWVEANTLKEGDKLVVLANRCKRCGKLIPYFNKYCSKTCNSLDITDKQWSDTGSQINTTPKEVEEELARVLGNHTGEYETIDIEIEKVKRWVIKRNRTLYNLSVEEDESYMAKGIVVHNCRCMALPTMPIKDKKAVKKAAKKAAETI